MFSGEIVHSCNVIFQLGLFDELSYKVQQLAGKADSYSGRSAIASDYTYSAMPENFDGQTFDFFSL